MNDIQEGSIVVWSKRSKRGNAVVYSKHSGKVLLIDDQIATVQRRGNNHKVKVHLSRLTLQPNDAPLSLVVRAKREFGVLA